MNTGELRHQIEIQSAVETQDAMGGTIRNWTTDQTIWAKISPVLGRETTVGNTQHAEVTHDILIRWNTGIDPKKRIKHESRIFKIQNVLDIDERREKLMIKAIEVLDGED